MKDLVTGGAGFIGSHLTEALLNRGDEVVVLDDLSTGRLENLRDVAHHPRLTIINGSSLDENLVRKAMEACDDVYHLGAAVGVKLVVERPVHAIETNVNGTNTVLRAALRQGSKVFIASTSEVYGKDSRVGRDRFRETDDITFGVSMRWCYASSKALDEYLSRAYYLEEGLPVVVGRFFNTVGPRQTGTYGMVVPRFIQQATEGRPITIYGDGNQVRTFTWVGDAAQAAMALMAHPGAVGEIFNIGSEEAVSVRDLAQMVKRITETNSEIVNVPYERAYGPNFEDTVYRVPDISKLKHLIGYEPSMSLEQILLQIISYNRRVVAFPSP